MKKIVSLTYVLLTIFLFGCSGSVTSSDKPPDNEAYIEGKPSLDKNDMDEESSNDLIYRDYDSGIELSENTIMIINIPEFEEVEESEISITIINNTNQTIESAITYNNETSISYMVNEMGAYSVYATIKDVTGNKEIIDLVDNLSFETNYNTVDSNFIY